MLSGWGVLAYERITGDGARDTLNQPGIVSVSVLGASASIRQGAGFLSTGKLNIFV